MKKLRDWIIDKWLGGFITTCIFFILKLYIDLPKETKTNFFSFNWLKELLNFQIPFWWVIIIILVVIIFTKLKRVITKGEKRGDSLFETPKNRFENYRSDVFGFNKTKWTWNYDWDIFQNKFIIVGVKPVCKQCGTSMEIGMMMNNAECHKCRLDGRQYRFDLTEHREDIEKEILRRIQNNEVKIQPNS